MKRESTKCRIEWNKWLSSLTPASLETEFEMMNTDFTNDKLQNEKPMIKMVFFSVIKLV